MHCEHRPQQATTLERPDEHTASIHCVRFREHILKYHFDYEEGYPHSSFITNRSLFPFLCFFSQHQLMTNFIGLWCWVTLESERHQ